MCFLLNNRLILGEKTLTLFPVSLYLKVAEETRRRFEYNFFKKSIEYSEEQTLKCFNM